MVYRINMLAENLGISEDPPEDPESGDSNEDAAEKEDLLKEKLKPRADSLPLEVDRVVADSINLRQVNELNAIAGGDNAS